MAYSLSTSFAAASSGAVPGGWIDVSTAFSIAGSSGSRYATCGTDFDLLLAPDATTPANRLSLENGEVFVLPGALDGTAIVAARVGSSDTSAGSGSNYLMNLLVDGTLALYRNKGGASGNPLTLSGYVAGQILGLRVVTSGSHALVRISLYASGSAVDGTAFPVAFATFDDSDPVAAGGWGLTRFVDSDSGGSAAMLAVSGIVVSAAGAALTWVGRSRVQFAVNDVPVVGQTYDAQVFSGATLVASAAFSDPTLPQFVPGLAPLASYTAVVRSNLSGQPSVSAPGVVFETVGVRDPLFGFCGNSIPDGDAGGGVGTPARAAALAAVRLRDVHGYNVKVVGNLAGMCSIDGLTVFGGTKAREWVKSPNLTSDQLLAVPPGSFSFSTLRQVILDYEVDTLGVYFNTNETWVLNAFDTSQAMTPETELEYQGHIQQLCSDLLGDVPALRKIVLMSAIPFVPDTAAYVVFTSASLAALQLYRPAQQAAAASFGGGRVRTDVWIGPEIYAQFEANIATWLPALGEPVHPHTSDALAALGAAWGDAFALALANYEWFVLEPDGGSIDSEGNYVAPGSAGTYHVAAVSLTDPTQVGVATVEVA